MKNWIIKIKKGICVFMGILRKNVDLLGFIVSLVSLAIAFYAIHSVLKIEGFEKLLTATSESALKLAKMDSTLSEQNRLQEINIGRNDSGLVELKKQTKTLIDLQKLNSAQLSIQRKVDKSNIIGDCQILEGLWEKLTFMLRMGNNDNPFPTDTSFRKRTIKFLVDLKALVNQGINNNLLKTHEKIYSQWVYYNSQIEHTLYFLNFSKENAITKYFGIPISITGLSPNPSIKPPTKEESDIDQLKVLNEWTKRFWNKDVEPMMDIKEIQTYRHNNMTNYNRVTNE
jgi:hypothetical protein